MCKIQRSACLCAFPHPSTGVTDTRCYTWLFLCVMGIQMQILRLAGQATHLPSHIN